MHTVFILPHARFNIHFSLMLDEAVVAHEAGQKVSVVFCDGSLKYCRTNICASKMVCGVCRFLVKRALEKMPAAVQIYPLSRFIDESDRKEVEKLSFAYHSIEELKAIEYHGVDIGYSVLSFYVDLKRNLYPEFTPETIAFFDQLLHVSAQLVHAVEKMDQQLNPDIYSVFNGRLFDARAFFRRPLLLGRKTHCFELEAHAPTWEYRSLCFENALPHNIKANTDKILSFWEESKQQHTETEMVKQASAFFDLRRKKQPTDAKICFIENQIEGALPSGWDTTRRNFVFLNSSEDEFAGIDTEYDHFKYLPTQIAIIEKVAGLAAQISDRIHIYLRIHPNLRNVQHNYHKDLLKLGDRFSNLTVIPADSAISTYTLIDSAEKVLVVGSTVGIEAIYAGIPVVLLGPAMYQLLGSCYIPRNDEELKEMLERFLEPQSRLPAYQYGYYIVSEKGRRWKYFDFGSPGRCHMLGLRIPITNYYTLWGSSKLMGFLYKIVVENLLFIPFQLKRSTFRYLGITRV